MKRILVIDDDIYIRDIISIYLVNYGYEVIGAENGKIGLEKANECNPDLIISDIRMPEMDGFELLNNIRKNANTENIPFILITEIASLEAKKLSKELGANEFIAKPFVLKEFLMVIKSLLINQKIEANKT